MHDYARVMAIDGRIMPSVAFDRDRTCANAGSVSKTSTARCSNIVDGVRTLSTARIS